MNDEGETSGLVCDDDEIGSSTQARLRIAPMTARDPSLSSGTSNNCRRNETRGSKSETKIKIHNSMLIHHKLLQVETGRL